MHTSYSSSTAPPLLPQRAEIEPAALVDRAPQLVQPRAAALAEPIRGVRDVGGTVVLGGRDPFQQGIGEPLDMAQAAGTAQRRELRPLFVVRRRTPGAVRVLMKYSGSQSASRRRGLSAMGRYCSKRSE